MHICTDLYQCYDITVSAIIPAYFQLLTFFSIFKIIFLVTNNKKVHRPKVKKNEKNGKKRTKTKKTKKTKKHFSKNGKV